MTDAALNSFGWFLMGFGCANLITLVLVVARDLKRDKNDTN